MIKLVTILLLLFTTGDLTEIAKINKLKKNAELAYESGQYDIAITNYVQLVDSMNIDEDEIILNLGHAYYQGGQPENAEIEYKKLTNSENKTIKSIAYQQLGFLSSDSKTLENALAFFKAALKADPSNEDARYNYELIKKKLRDQNENQSQGQDDQQNQDQNDEDKQDQEQQENEEKQDGDKQDQENQDQEGEENQDQESQEEEGQEDNQEQEQQNQQSQEDQENGEQSEEEQQGQNGEESDEQKEQEQQQGEQSEEGEEDKEQKQAGEEQEEGEENQEMSQQQQTAQKLEEMNISEEKAKMILEALKNSEVQYIQQNRRMPSQNRDSDKPDW